MHERTPTSTVYANPDGTRTLRVYSEPVFIEGAHGQYVSIDPSLHRGGDGRYTPAAAAPVSIADRATDPTVASMRFGSASAGFGVDQASPVTPSVTGDTASFTGIRNGADLRLQATADTLKETIVLRSAAAPTSWLFPLTLNGLTPVLDKDSGAVLLKDAGGTVVGQIPAGFMVDAKVDPESGVGARSDAVTYALVSRGSGVALRVDLDAAWLHDPARQFPVVADPTLTRYNLDSDDTYVSSRDRAGKDNSAEGDLLVGTYNGGIERDASYLHFNEMTGALANRYILGATLNLYDFWSYSCNARPVTVYRVTQQWSGPSTRSWPGPSYDAAHPLSSSSFAYGYSPDCPNGGWAQFPIDRTEATMWTHGREPFYGFTVRASETDKYGWKRFSSANYFDPTAHPFIDVNYADQGASYALTSNGFSPNVSATQAGGITVRVTNLGTATWLAGSDYKLTWSVTNSGGTQVASGGPYAMPWDVAPGQSADVPIQVGPISGLGDFTLRLDMVNAAGSFQAVYGSPMGTAGFSIVNGPPQPKAVYPVNNGYVDSVKPTLWTQYYDPDGYGTAQTYNYQVCAGTPDAPVGCQSSGVINAAAWAVPAGTLRFGQQGFWYVTLSDGLASQQYGPYWFTVVSTQPEITGHLAGAPDNPDTPGLNPQVGNYTTTVTDASVPVTGPPLAITRTYNSQDPRTLNAFGSGWSSPIDQLATFEADGNVTVRLATGLDVRFGHNPQDDSFSPPAGMNLTLNWVYSQSVLVLRDSTGQLTYFNADGRLRQVVDPDGRTQNYQYAGGRVAQIIDGGSGRALHLQWTNGHVTTVTEEAAAPGASPQSWTYTYSGDMLTKVCSPLSAGACTSYGYNPSSFYQDTVQDDNPAAYWPLNDLQGSIARNNVATTAGDLDAAYNGVTLGQPGSEAFSANTSIGLPGRITPAYVALPDNLLNQSMGFAVELWFHLDAGQAGILFSQQTDPVTSAADSSVPMLYVGTDGKLRGEAWMGAVSPMTSSGRVDDGAWHHVVLSAAVNTQSLYLDGSFVASLAGQIDHGKRTKYRLGVGVPSATWPASPGFFTGRVDDTAVYRHALSQAQILAHYNARAGGNRLTTVTEPGAVTAATVGYDTSTGRVTSLVDNNGATWNLDAPTTDNGTREVQLSSSIRAPITYKFDIGNGGRLTDRTDGSGTTTWAYNDAGFVSALTDPNTNTTSYQTDARGNVLAKTTCRTPSSCQTEYFGYYLSIANPTDPRNDKMIWQSDARSASATDTTYRTTYTLDVQGHTTTTTYPVPASQSTAPTESVVYSNGPGYGYSTHALRFTPAGGTALALTGDDANQQISLPFPFTFYGHQYQSAWVSTNGYLSFTRPAGTGYPTAQQPVPDAYTNSLDVFADDLVVDASASVVTAVTGTAPNREFVVEWRNVYSKSDPAARFSAQATLDESGPIFLAYNNSGTPVAKGSHATVGVVDWGGSTAAIYSYHQPNVGANTRITVAQTVASSADYQTRSRTGWYTSAGTVLPLTGDEAVTDFNLTVPVVLYGQSYTHAWVSSNGFVAFQNPGGAHGTGRTSLPNAAAPSTAVFPFWDDLTIGAAGKVTTGVYGDAPNRETIIEWQNVALTRDLAKLLSFAVDFHENGQITFNYKGLDNADEKGLAATIGVQNNATTAAQYSYQQASVDNQQEVGFVPNGTEGSAAPPGLPLSTTARNNASTNYAYDNFGNLSSVNDPAGLMTHYGYDGLGRRTSVYQDGWVGAVRVNYGTTATTYNAVSEVATVTGSSVTNPVTGVTHTAVTTYTYNDRGQQLTSVVSDSIGGDPSRTTTWTYDTAGRLASTKTPDQATTTQTWDNAGNLATVTQPNGLIRAYQYNDHHQLIETDANGAGADPMDPNATSLVLDSRAYDPGGRLAVDIDAMGRETDYDYFGDDLPQAMNRVQHDGSGTVISSSPLGSYDYDSAGHLTLVNDARGVPTTATYDPTGYLTSTVLDPSGLARRMSYVNNLDGSLASQTLTGNLSPGRAETTSYTYDQSGRLLTQSTANTGGSPATLTTTLVRDRRGLVTSQTDPAGITTQYTYDNHGLLASTTGASRTTWVNGTSTTGVTPVTTFGYNTFGDPTDETDPAGSVTHTSVDTMGRTTAISLPAYTPPGGSTINASAGLQYDAQGNVKQVTDGLNRTTQLTYDKYGELVSMTAPDPDGSGPKTSPVITLSYDRDGELLAATDPAGGQTSATYDNLGRQITATTTDRDTGSTLYLTTSLHYDAGGNLTQITSPLGKSTYLGYDAAGDATTVDDASGRRDFIGYDMAGRMVSNVFGFNLAHPGGIKPGDPPPQTPWTYANPLTTYAYDLAGRRTSQSDCTTSTTGGCAAIQRTQSWTYDGDGQTLQATSAAGRPSVNTYDGAGQLSSVTQLVDPTNPATAATVQLGYDALGNRTHMVDGNGNTTTYTYNVWGLPESVIEPSTPDQPNAADRTWTTTYDAAAQAVKELLPGGITRNSTYNALGQLMDETGTGATTDARHLDYDAAGRLAKVSGPAGDTTYTYNDRGLLTHTAGANTATFTYDSDGNMATRTDAAGTATFTYDDLGRVKTATDPLTGQKPSYSYDVNGNLSAVSYGTGLPSHSYAYDDLGRVVSDTQTKANGGTAASTAYSYDTDGLLTSKTTTGYAGAGANSYTYDGLGRLISWTRPDGTQAQYGYDAASNRTSITDPTGTRTTTYDARNRQVSASGAGQPTQTWTWTPRGTLASTTSGSSTSSYTYDAFERMTVAAVPGHTDTYTYDGLDRLAQHNGVGLKYDDQSNNSVNLPDDAGNPMLVFRDPTGTPVSSKTGSNAPTELVNDPLHADVVGAIDPSTGDLQASASYDPYGQKTASSGGLPLGYQGGYTDPSTGLVNAQSRWYNPTSGTFNSRDTTTLTPSPVSQANRYLYAGDSPTNATDTSGHNYLPDPPNGGGGGSGCGGGNGGGGGGFYPIDCPPGGPCDGMMSVTPNSDPCGGDGGECGALVSYGDCPPGGSGEAPPPVGGGGHESGGGHNSGGGNSGGKGGGKGSGGTGGGSGHVTPAPVQPRPPLDPQKLGTPPTEDITGGVPLQNNPSSNAPPALDPCDHACQLAELPSAPVRPQSPADPSPAPAPQPGQQPGGSLPNAPTVPSPGPGLSPSSPSGTCNPNSSTCAAQQNSSRIDGNRCPRGFAWICSDIATLTPPGVRQRVSSWALWALWGIRSVWDRISSCPWGSTCDRQQVRTGFDNLNTVWCNIPHGSAWFGLGLAVGSVSFFLSATIGFLISGLSLWTAVWSLRCSYGWNKPAN